MRMVPLSEDVRAVRVRRICAARGDQRVLKISAVAALSCAGVHHVVWRHNEIAIAMLRGQGTALQPRVLTEAPETEHYQAH